MQDRPTSIELLEAAAKFVDRELVPAIEGARQFQARVVANVMRIVAREIEMEERLLFDEVETLISLIGAEKPHLHERGKLREFAVKLSEELSERIKKGEADAGEWRAKVLAGVRKIVEDKLRVANPRYLESDLKARGV